MIVLLLLVFLWCGNVYADMFAVEKQDGGIVIVNYDPSSSDSLEDVMAELGMTGQPVKRITHEDLPDRLDRDFWVMNDVSIGKKIVADEDAKLKAKEEKDKIISDKQDARKKICPNCTDDDFKKAFGD